MCIIPPAGKDQPIVRISAKTEYACIAMLELASQYGVGRAGPNSADCRAARRAAAVPRADSAAIEGGGAGEQRSRAPPAAINSSSRPRKSRWDRSWRSSTARRRRSGQTSSASPDSPAVKVLMQAWKEVAAAAAQDARRDHAGRSARTGEGAGRADVPHLKRESAYAVCGHGMRSHAKHGT